MSHETKKFPIEDVVRDASCQSRAIGNAEATDDYAAHLRAGGTLPDIEVFLVNGVPYVVDGFHRLDAHLAAGVTFVRAVIVGRGTVDEAAWYATGANKSNGLRRTNADKRKAVRNALTNPIGSEQSSRTIADHVGVSDFLVREVREEVEGQLRDSRSSAPAAPKRLVGKDGKSRPATHPKPRAKAPESRVELDDAPAWTPPPAKERALDDAVTATPREDCRSWLEAADVLQAARLRCKALLPDERFSRVEAALRSEERLLRASVPVVCPACGGPGCTVCQRRGWMPASQAKEAVADA